MGATKNWAMIVQELHDARDHWQTCNHDCQQAIRNELEAHMRLERAMAEHQREVKAFIASQDAQEGHTPTAVASDGPGSSKDAPGSFPDGPCEETCAECGRPVPEDECDGSAPCLHVDCEAEYRQGRREAQSDAVADAVMFGQGKGGF